MTPDLRKLCEAATPGYVAIAQTGYGPPERPRYLVSAAGRRFLDAARTAIPELLDERARLLREVERLRRLCMGA